MQPPSVTRPGQLVQREIIELERVRDTLIRTVLEARAACEAGSGGSGAQMLLCAAVSDVEELDLNLQALRGTAS